MFNDIYGRVLPEFFTRTHAHTHSVHVLASTRTQTTHANTHAHACTHARTHAPHAHSRTHTHTHIRTRARTHACAHTKAHTRIHTHAHSHARLHTHARTHAHTPAFTFPPTPTPTCLTRAHTPPHTNKHACMHARTLARMEVHMLQAFVLVVCVTCLLAFRHQIANMFTCARSSFHILRQFDTRPRACTCVSMSLLYVSHFPQRKSCTCALLVCDPDNSKHVVFKEGLGKYLITLSQSTRCRISSCVRIDRCSITQESDIQLCHNF